MKARTHSPVFSLFVKSLGGLAAVALFMMPGEAGATAYTWNNTGTGPWATATNWTPNGTPGSGDTIAVGGSTARNITLDAARTVSGITVTNSANTTFSSTGSAQNLTVSGNLSFGTSVTFGSGTAANNLNLLLGTNTLTLTGGDIGLYGSNTMGGAVIKAGNVFLRAANGFGTTGNVQLGDTAANTAVPTVRGVTATFARPFVLNNGSTNGVAIDSLGNGATPTFTGGVTGTNTNLTIRSGIGTGTGSITFSTNPINHTGALSLANSSDGSTASTGAGTVTISSVIGTNVTGVTVSRSGISTGVQKVVLSGSNTYTSPTTLASGILQVGHANGMGSGNITFTGGTLLYGSGITTDFSGRFRNSTAAIKLDPAGATLTMASNIASTNTGGLTMFGTGTLTLSGTNAYTGATTFAAGTVVANTAGALSTGNLTFTGGTLKYGPGVTADFSSRLVGSTSTIKIDSGGNDFTWASDIPASNTAGMTLSGTGIHKLSGNSAYSGTTSVQAGTLLLGSNTAVGTGTLNVGFSTPASAYTDGAFTVANPIQMNANPSSGFNVLGGNTDNTSTFSGALLMAGNATFAQVATTGTNALNLTGGMGTNNPGTYTATFAGPGKINVTGAMTNGSIGVLAATVSGGDVTFSGANTYTGITKVTGGSLTLTAPNMLPNAANVEVTTGATLNLNYTGNDRIQYLVIDGVQQANGTWGRNGSGAQHESSLITGDGILYTGPLVYTWNSSGGSGLLSTAANWDVNFSPVFASTLTFGAGSYDTAVTNDFAADMVMDRIRFLSGALAYTLGGTNNLVLTGGIDNASSNIQTITFPIGLGSAAVALNPTTADLLLTGVISGTGGLNKTGAGIARLEGTNTYTGMTKVTAGTLQAGSAGAIPSGTTLAFGNTTNAVTFDITGWTQTVANITFGSQTTGSNAITILGDSTTSLTTSPAILLFAPAASANAVLTVNMSSLGAFTYNNPTGAINLQTGGGSFTGTTVVTLSGKLNEITANSISLGNISAGSGSANGNLSTLNLGQTNKLHVNNLSVGAPSGRASGLLQFGGGLLSGPTLEIRNAAGTGPANVTVGRNSSFGGDTVVYNSALDTATGGGILDALVDTLTVGAANSDGAATGRQVNSSGTFKMGAGTLTAATATIGALTGTTPTGPNNYTGTGLLDLRNAGTANIGTLTLANNALGTLLGGTNVIDGQVNISDFATLNATTIQQGTVVTGETTRVARINWYNGTIGNLAATDLTISGVSIVMASFDPHTFNVTAGKTANVSAVISSTPFQANALTKTGAGTLNLTGANTYAGDTNVAEGTMSINSAFLYDEATLEVSTGAKLNLNFTGADKVAFLTFNGVQQTGNGTTYGATGSGAMVIDNVHFSGTGRIQVGVNPDPFLSWASGFTLAGGDADKTADPDHDGRTNLLEFALDGDPKSALNDRKMRSVVATVGVEQTLTLTIPVRTGVTFTAGGDLVGTIDKVTYKIQGSTTLTDFTTVDVTEVSPALSSGMPNLTEGGGWEYRTFRMPGSITTNPRGFLRVAVEEAP